MPTSARADYEGAPFLAELPDSANFNQLQLHRDVVPVRQRLTRFDQTSFRSYLDASDSLPAFHLRVFSDADLVVQPMRIDRSPDGIVTIAGRLQNDPSSDVMLVVNGDALVAQISATRLRENFEIRPLGEGAHVIRAQVSSGGNEGGDAAETPALNTNLPAPGNAEIGLFSPESAPVIDMLVAYTPNAKAEQGGDNGIQALIQMGIADANRAFEASGALVRVRLVGTIETRQNETGDLTRDLYSLQNTKSGFWSELHAERSRVHAAQVSVVGVYRGVYSPTGIAFFSAHPDSAFSVLKTSAFSQYTLAHELGHNLGLDHSDGYQNNSGRFTTIMAYGAFPRICRFSNPQLPYEGFNTGDQAHNEVSIINKNAARVAAFRGLF